MIFDEPTRGIDVGAKTEIYELMRALADAGVAILMISSDMEEVIGVSDRIAVMHEGAISGFLERDQFSEDNVLQLAVGKPRRAERGGEMMQERPRPAHPDPRRRRRRGAPSTRCFLSPINLANTANLIGLFGLFSIGQAFVIITGGIELSVGSIIALLGVLFVDLDRQSRRALAARAAAHARRSALLIGLAHGLLITRLKMQPFVVTLCGLLIYRGVARFYTADAHRRLRLRRQTFPTSNG